MFATILLAAAILALSSLLLARPLLRRAR